MIRWDGLPEGCRWGQRGWRYGRKEKTPPFAIFQRDDGAGTEKRPMQGETIIDFPFTFYDIDAFFRVQRFF